MEQPKRSERNFVRVQEIIEKHGANEAALIPILQHVQEEYRYLPEEILAYIATAINVSPATVCGVATFYAQFSLEPKGKHVVRVCDGTACHVRDNRALVQAIQKRLKLEGKTKTTPDAMYTLEIVNCIGACALAPAVVVDEQVYGQMTGEKMIRLFNQIDARDREER
jgi:NADH-quinone oxidoreductase subunit E